MSPLYDWDDPDELRASVARERAQMDRIRSYRGKVTAQQAAAVSNLFAAYPHMSPGTVGPLALAGVKPETPVAQRAAVAEAKSNKKKRGVMDAIGDFVSTPARLAVDAMGEVADVGSAILKPVVRYGTAALSAPLEEGVGLLRTIAAETGEFAAGAAAGAMTGASIGLMGGGGIGAIPGAIGGALVGGTLGAVGQSKDIVKGEGGFRWQSTLASSLTGGGSMGSGYLPGGEAAATAAKRARQTATVNGAGLTPGRLFAATLFSEDHAAYNVLSGAIDMANAWKLDPSEHLLRRAGVAKAKRASFNPAAVADARRQDLLWGRWNKAQSPTSATRAEAGVMDGGTRPTVIWENASRWLTSDARGQRFVEWATDEKDFETIRRALPGISPEMAADLQDASTRDEVLDLLLPKIQDGKARGLGYERGLTHKNLRPASVRGQAGITVARRFAQSRFWGSMPGSEVNFLDTTGTVDWFSDFQRNMNVSADTVSANTRALTDALRNNDYTEARRIIAGSVVGPDGALARGRTKINPDLDFMKRTTQTYLESISQLERRAHFESGMGVSVTHTNIADESFGLAPAVELAGDLASGFKFDRNALREMRGATARYGLDNVYMTGLWKTSTAALDFVTSQIWKPAALLRGAYTVRVIAEEQIRLANAGATSMFSHPLSYLAWAASDGGRIGKLLGRMGVDVRRGDIDLLGDIFTERPATFEEMIRGDFGEFQAALGRRASQEHWGVGASRKMNKTTYRRGEQGHVVALHEAIAKMHLDPVTRRVANGNLLPDDPEDWRVGPPAIRNWLENGPGAEVRRTAGRLSAPAAVDDILTRAQQVVDDLTGVQYGKVAELKPVPNATGGPPGPSGQTRRPVPQGRPPSLPPKPKPPEKPYGLGMDPATARKQGKEGLASQEWARRQEKYRTEVAKWEAEVKRITDQHNRTQASNAASRNQGLPTRPSVSPSYGPTPGGTINPIVTQAGNARVREAIATGQLDGVSIFDERGMLNKKFRDLLGPETETAAFEIVGDAIELDTLKTKYDRALEGMFNALMGNRTAQLSRSPFFRQYYWREAATLLSEVDAAGQARLLANLEKAELPAAYIDNVKKAIARGSGQMTLEQADTLLKGRALDSTRQLLYDVAQKGQSSDVLRIIYPFLEAQKEVLKTWARLGTENPQTIRRGAQIINGARGAGVFYQDPQTGEEMFLYPGADIITEAMFDIPVPLGGRVEGLSMFGSGLLPGAGPVVQLGARWFLPDKPGYDSIREMIDPFGETASDDPFELFFPGWSKALGKAVDADDSDSQFGDMIFDVYASGLSSGEYRNDTPENIAEDMEKAKSVARKLFAIRGFASLAGAPTTVNPEFLAQDKDGTWSMFGALKEEYRKFMDEDPLTATERFVEKFGVNVAGLLQPSTYTAGKVLPESQADAGMWVRQHPGLVERFPNTYGVFAPTSATDEFDYQTWARQVRSGERVPLDPDQRAALMNDRLAKSILYTAKDKFGPHPNKGQRQFLSTLRDALVKEYPGFEQNIGLPEKVKPEQLIAELERAVEDPELADDPTANSLRIYFTARAKMNEMAKAAGNDSFAKAKKLRPMRQFMRQLGEALVAENRAFATAWDRVLMREMIDDEFLPTERAAMEEAVGELVG